jgi:hypothetical protein
MTERRKATTRTAILLAVSIFAGACIASTPMASASSPQVVYITATRDGGERGSAPTPTLTLELAGSATETPPLPEIAYAVENRTGVNIHDVFIREGEETAWGANRLSADLHPGESFSLPLTAGFYDVQVPDCMGGVLYEEHDTPIGSDPGSRTTLVQPMIRFCFENTHPNAVCELKAGPTGGTLSEVTFPYYGAIDPGERIGLELLAGKYGFRFQGCGGSAFFGAYGNVYVGPAMEGVP